ncbi:hypothetical protein EDC01DRAFT_669618 [Geopyxis carbonaria]|nr:hypothetical protein EDC01DRAFT_669618 [Geopyxis carbonaria]
MSHSKRNTSLAFFTSYERSLLKGDYGKQRTRLTRDSFKSFDACNLCLMRARDPVACPNGDLFCNECAIENLLSQHKEIERMQAELDRQLKEEEEDAARDEEEAKQRTVQDFELLQMGLEIRNSRQGVRQKVVGRENGKLLIEEEGGDDKTERENKKRKFELDEDELMRLAREERQKARTALTEEKSAAASTKLPSFWVPSLTPSVAAADVVKKPPKLKPVCPASEKNHMHNYGLKSLVRVKFTEEKDEKTKYGEPQRICPACKKGLSNSIKAMMAKPCGHVVCKPCADKFMTPSDDPHDTSDKTVRCYVCEADLTDKKKPSKKNKDAIRPGLVQIQSDGTGFSAGGGNVTTEKQGIAFQC